MADYLESIDMPRSDGEALFDKWEGNGWTNQGKAIKCWRSTARSWKRQGYLAKPTAGERLQAHQGRL